MSHLTSGMTLLLGAGVAFVACARRPTHREQAAAEPAPSVAPPQTTERCSEHGAGDAVVPPLPFSVRFAVGPMVGQSDRAFRLLTRAHGATVAYTPMLYASRFADEAYVARAIDFDPTRFPEAERDRPLIVQFAANDPALLLKAAQHVEPMCDAVDINLGCPQDRAREGHFGSYLTGRRDWPLVCRMVSTLRAHLTIPVMCKIRLLSSFEETLEFCLLLQDAGCACIAIHGRTRGSSRRRRVGPADLDQIARLRRELRVPVIANGNIRTHADALRNLADTGCEGVMSAEAVLANPRLFAGDDATEVTCTQLAHESEHGYTMERVYLDYCLRYTPPPLHWMSDHVHNIARRTLTSHNFLDLKSQLKQLGRESSDLVDESNPRTMTREEATKGIARLRAIIDELGARLQAARALVDDTSEATTRAYRHRTRQAHKLAAAAAAEETDAADMQDLFGV